jgi:hypothetical protein
MCFFDLCGHQQEKLLFINLYCMVNWITADSVVCSYSYSNIQYT